MTKMCTGTRPLAQTNKISRSHTPQLDLQRLEEAEEEEE